MAIVCDSLENIDPVIQVPFREELIAELKFILSFSGDTKPVRHRESTGSGSSKGKEDGEEDRNSIDVESPQEDAGEQVNGHTTPQRRSERSQSLSHSHHTLHSRRQSNTGHMARMRKFSRA